MKSPAYCNRGLFLLRTSTRSTFDWLVTTSNMLEERDAHETTFLQGDLRNCLLAQQRLHISDNCVLIARIRYMRAYYMEGGRAHTQAEASATHTLYLRSPMARERFKLPFTRCWPCMSVTNPPAATIRFRSVSWFGLWSYESAMALPALQFYTHHKTNMFS